MVPLQTRSSGSPVFTLRYVLPALPFYGLALIVLTAFIGGAGISLYLNAEFGASRVGDLGRWIALVCDIFKIGLSAAFVYLAGWLTRLFALAGIISFSLLSILSSYGYYIHYFAEHAQPHIWHVVALCLYTGQRITDVLKMKWTDIRDDILLVKQEKTKKPLFIPIHPELKSIIADIPKVSIFVLTNSRRIPWKSGWNAALQKQMDKPEMKPLKKDRLVTHGLRKSACVFLAECGCTDAEIQAITGHSKAMVEYYRKGVDQKKLAKKAILKFSRNSE